MLSGRLPHQHGIHTYQRNFACLNTEKIITGELTEHTAIGVSANVYASSAFGFDTLFDEFVDISPTHRFPDGLDVRRFGFECEADGLKYYSKLLEKALSHEHPVKSVSNEVLAKVYHLSRELPIPTVLDDGAKIVSRTALRSVKQFDEPYFLFVNYMDAHGPLHHVRGYDKSLHSVSSRWSSSDHDEWNVMTSGDELYLENYRDLYGAAIEYLDRKVRSLVEDIQVTSGRETTFVITADHGENLGYPEDEKLLDHSSSLTEGLLHVPCLVINPPEGMRSEGNRYFSHLKLRDFIKGLASGETPDLLRNSVAAEVIGKTAGIDPRDNQEWWNRLIRCTYQDNKKFVWDSLGNKELFRIDRDQSSYQRECSGNEITVDSREHFEQDIETYRKHVVSDVSDSEVNDETVARLKDLGYL